MKPSLNAFKALLLGLANGRATKIIVQNAEALGLGANHLQLLIERSPRLKHLELHALETSWYGGHVLAVHLNHLIRPLPELETLVLDRIVDTNPMLLNSLMNYAASTLKDLTIIGAPQYLVPSLKALSLVHLKLVMGYRTFDTGPSDEYRSVCMVSNSYNNLLGLSHLLILSRMISWIGCPTLSSYTLTIVKFYSAGPHPSPPNLGEG
jgi:hypothetical protein